MPDTSLLLQKVNAYKCIIYGVDTLMSSSQVTCHVQPLGHTSADQFAFDLVS